MNLPVIVPLGAIEFHEIILSDTEPTPPLGYIVIQLGTAHGTKVWLIYQILT